MKRLNDEELNVRIHNFMSRKMEEFPELKPNSAIQDNTVRGARENSDVFRTTNRFGFHWHTSPRTA
jgi:hypothetical protein